MMVSIIIRTYNEEKYIKKLLDAIYTQNYNDYEVIVVDSGSTDNTLKIAESYDFVKVIKIKKDDFTFGYSLNKGIENSKGKYCLMVSGHCIPKNEFWIENLIKPFKDKMVGISYGRQIGNDNTKFSEHQIFESWFPSKSNYDQKIPFCNNANCAILKSVWEKLGGYDERVSGLEDLLISKKMLNTTNYKIVYESSSVVYHIHDETWSQIRNRYYREAITYSNINIHEKFTLFDFIKLSFINIKHDFKKLLKDKRYKISTLIPIILFRFNQFWGTYKGYKFTKKYNSLRKRFYYPL